LSSKKTERLAGEVVSPGSKSQTIRGLIFALLADGRSVLRRPLDSEDTRWAINVCRGLGADVAKDKNGNFIVKSRGAPLEESKKAINTGDSGITTNFILPALGLRRDNEKEIILDCGEQMRRRPVRPLINALSNLGMTAASKNAGSVFPLIISGRLLGGKTGVDGFISQYLSGLLISLPLAIKDSEVSVLDLRERPYAEMTLAWLDEQGIEYKHEQKGNKDVYKIKGRQKYRSFNKTIPVDFSSASCLLAAGALMPGEVIFKGLDMNDRQADKQLIHILREMGADIEIGNSEIKVRGGKKLRGIKINCADIPDLVPALAVIGTQAEGATELVKAGQARLKETDRLHSMAEGLGRLGARITEKKDGLKIFQSKLRGAPVAGRGDHRTVMALAIAGLFAEGRTSVDSAESVKKTFPDFPEAMRKIGAKIGVKK
jgi:3-phosphoshikimate 1-carboxyvinyltransferase